MSKMIGSQSHLGWRTSKWNTKGTGHYFVGNKWSALAEARCGRLEMVADLQDESQVIKKCKRCMKSKNWT